MPFTKTIGTMTIGAAAKTTGISAKMIRYYESIGLIPSATRTGAGYRLYSPGEVDGLRFIKRARTLGFSLEQIAELLALWRDPSRASAGVKQVARRHVATLQDHITELQGMVRSLNQLIDHCHGDARHDCPILEDLADHRPPPTPRARQSSARSRAPLHTTGSRV